MAVLEDDLGILTDPRFDKILNRTLSLEGGATVDEGGPTNLGITQTTLDSYNSKRKLPKEDVNSIGIEKAKTIYKDEFYLGPKINQLPGNIADVVFDYGVQSSPSRAIKSLQKIVGTEADGNIGPHTLKATMDYIENNGEKPLLQSIMDQREEFIKTTPAYKSKPKGMINRLNKIKDEFDLSALNPFQVKEASADEMKLEDDLGIFSEKESVKPNLKDDLGLFGKPWTPRDDLSPLQKTLTSPASNAIFDAMGKIDITPDEESFKFAFEGAKKRVRDTAVGVNELIVKPFGRGVEKAIGGTPELAGQVLKNLGDTIERGGPKPKWFDISTPIGHEIKRRGQEMIVKNKQAIAKKFPEQATGLEKFSEDLGSGAVSIGAALGIGALTGGMGAGIAFGGAQKVRKYSDLIDRGVSSQSANSLSNVYGLVEGGLEYVGIHTLLTSKGSTLVRGAIGVATEAIQEFSQQLGEGEIDVLTGLRKDKGLEAQKSIIAESLYAGAIGAILGGPAAVAVSFAQRDAIAEGLQSVGMNKEESVKKADEMMKQFTDEELMPAVEATIKGLEIKGEPVQDESLPTTKTTSEGKEIPTVIESKELPKETPAAPTAPIPEIVQPKPIVAKKIEVSDEEKRKLDEMSELLSMGQAPQVLKTETGYIRTKSTNPAFFQARTDKKFTKKKIMDMLRKRASGEELSDKEMASLTDMMQQYDLSPEKGFKHAELKSKVEAETVAAIDRKDIDESESGELIQYADAGGQEAPGSGITTESFRDSKIAADYAVRLQESGGTLISVSADEEGNTLITARVPKNFNDKITPSGQVRQELQAPIPTELFQEKGEMFKGVEEGNIKYSKPEDFATAEEYVRSKMSKEYRSHHQIDSKTASPITEIDEALLNSFVNEFKNQYGYPALKLKDVSKLKEIINNTDAAVTVYRVSPKDELNSGDWVTIDKSYAGDIRRQNGGKVFTHTVKAKDLFYPKTVEGFRELPSLNKWGAFQYQSSDLKSQLISEWQEAQNKKTVSESQLDFLSKGEDNLAYGGQDEKTKAVQKTAAEVRRVNGGSGRGPAIRNPSQIVQELLEKGWVKYTGKNCTSSQEAAEIFSAVRNPYIEVFQALIVKNGVVVGHKILSNGMPNQVQDAKFLSDEAVIEAVRIGGDGIYLSHNHPSGDSAPSGQDVTFTREMSEIIKKANISFGGHVVTDGDNYTLIDNNNDIARMDWNKEDMVRGKSAIRSSSDVVTISKSFIEKDKLSVLILDSKHRVISVEQVIPDGIIMNKIVEAIRDNVASRVVVAMDESLYPKVKGSALPSEVLDVVVLNENGTYESFADGSEKLSFKTTTLNATKKSFKYVAEAEVDYKKETAYKPIETIEIVKLAKTLMGDYPTIKKMPKSRGLFHPQGKGSIKLIPELFKRGNEKQLSSTLAHEIGHLVDYLPEKTMKRGNLLGRIASLRDFLKTTLPKSISQSMDTILTTKDRQKIRKNVERKVGPRPAQDNEADLSAWKNEVSFEYAEAIIEEIDSRGLISEKQLRDEMIHLSFEWRPLDDVNDESYMAYRSSGKEIYADAISALLNNPEWTEEKAPLFYELFFEYLDRKPEVKEAYISAQKMMNGTPEEIMAARQQDVRMMFAKGEAIREQLDNQKKLDDMNMWDMLRTLLDDKYYPLLKKLESNNRKGIIPKSDAAHLLQELDLWTNDAHELTRQIDTEVIAPLKDAGATMNDLSEYMFLRRIIGKTSISEDEIIATLKAAGLEEYLGGIGIEIVDTKEEAEAKRQRIERETDGGTITEEIPVTSWEEQVAKWKEKNADREDLANPLGFSPETAQKQIDFLRGQIGDEAFGAIEKSAEKYHDLIFAVTEDAVKAGVYSQKVFDTVIAPNKNFYVTFGVLDYLDKSVPAMIKSQRGTLKEVESPFITTILKTVSLLRANAKNRAVSASITELASRFPGDAVESKRVIVGGIPARFANPKGGRGQVKFMRDGKLVSYDVDKYIAESFAQDSPTLIQLGANLNKWLGNKLFKGLVITYSPAFQVFNIQRDFKRTYINLNAMGKKVTILNLLGEYWKALPVAVRRMTGVDDATINEMMKNKALDLPFNDYNYDDRDDGFARILRKYNVIGPKMEAKTVREKVLKAVSAIDSAVRFVGNVIETLPKVAGYNAMKAKGASDRELGYFTREYIGTPNFRVKGSYTKITNELFIFSNIILHGMRSDARLATRPSTRAGYWWADFKMNHFYKLLMIAVATGLGGKWLKEWFAKVPEYDKTNFIIIPTGEDKEGRARYIRLPHNETSRMFSAILWKLGTMGEEKRQGTLAEVFSTTGGILPGISPTISTVGAWATFLGGKNPYDDYRGRYAISDKAWKAGGWPALKKMVEYSFNDLGFSQFTTYDDRRDTTFEAAMKATPVINSIFRIIKTSDYGLSEKAMAISQEETKESAQRNIKRDELFTKQLKGYSADNIGSMMNERGVRAGTSLRNELQKITKTLYDNPDKEDYKTTEKAFIRFALKEQNNPYVKSVLSAQSNETKIKILKEAKSTLSSSKYYEMLRTLRKTKIISQDVIDEVK